ncbi:MAG: hypothetical protein JAZ17_07905 [Candidatus Thiodiazotropha endolucinida]|nr:hypothetical protein [Candidatus Thiodiazotropha endolucinida]
MNISTITLYSLLLFLPLTVHSSPCYKFTHNKTILFDLGLYPIVDKAIERVDCPYSVFDEALNKYSDLCVFNITSKKTTGTDVDKAVFLELADKHCNNMFTTLSVEHKRRKSKKPLLRPNYDKLFKND